MSIDLMTQVWKSDAYDGGTLLVLLALADWADDDGGSIFPKVATIGKKARLGERQVQNCLKTLRDDGVLEQVTAPRRGRGTEYKLNIDRVKNLHRKNCGAIERADEVQRASGVGAKPIAPPIKEPSVEPSMNRHSPAPGGASETIASLREPEPHRFSDFRDAIDQTWPDGFVLEDEGKARSRFIKLTGRVPADTLIACARQHGAKKSAEKAARGNAGKMFLKRPSNWLKDGDWEGYDRLATQVIETERNTTLALARVHKALGAEIIELLKSRRVPDVSLAMLEGVSFEPGPPPVLAGNKSIQRFILEQHRFALARLLGEDLTIVITGSERKSA